MTTSTSHRQPPSTSSAKRASSKPWSDVVALGDRIVRDLGLDESTDTLGRWMAHRVAELIDGANTARGNDARARAATDATELILRLWAHRSNWPEGWPPASAVKVLSTLDRDPYKRESAPSGSPWLDSLSRLTDLQASERRIWVGVSLFDFDLNNEVGALEDDSAELTDEERKVFERLVWQHERAASEIFDGSVPRSAAGRAAVAQSKLAALGPTREALISEVVRTYARPGGDDRERGETKQVGAARRKASGVMRGRSRKG